MIAPFRHRVCESLDVADTAVILGAHLGLTF